MGDWSLEYTYNGSDVSLGAYYRNVIGFPVVSVSRIADLTAGAYCPICGVYRFFMESNTTVSVTSVFSADYKSPLIFQGSRVVVADGLTKNYNLIPGLGIVLSASTVWGNTFEVGVGCYWDSTLTAWVRMLPQDLCFPNVDKTELVVKAWNGTGVPQCNTFAIATNFIRVQNELYTNRPFMCFRQVGTLSPTAHDDINGRLVTFDNFYASTPNRACLLVDGLRYDIFDETNQATHINGMYLKCDGATVYRFADGTPYQSGEFILSSSLVVTDRAALYVSDAGDFVKIARYGEDFVPGPTGIWLTQEDCPEGTVEDGSFVEFRVKIVCPASKTNALNPRLASIRVGSEGI